MNKSAFVKVITWILILGAVVAAGVAIAHYTGGFTGDFTTFYLTVDDRDILSSAKGYKISPDKPLTVNVNYTFAGDSVSGYSLKVIPNAIAGEDFDFTIDGEIYSFQAETDLTAGFNIEQNEDNFVIKPKGSLNEIMAAVYPNSELSDVSEYSYNDMFMLVVNSYNDQATVTLAFSIEENITGIEVTPDHIYF